MTTKYPGECILHGDWDENYCGPECERLTAIFYAPIEPDSIEESS